MARFQCVSCHRIISGTKNGGFRMAGVDGYICKSCAFDRDHFTPEETVKILAYTKSKRMRDLEAKRGGLR